MSRVLDLEVVLALGVHIGVEHAHVSVVGTRELTRGGLAELPLTA